MDMTQQRDMLDLLKALADENRLMMLRLMSEDERTVSDMAEYLKLTEATVSHHVSKMHSAGLLNLRMAGTYRYYRVNPARMAKFRAYAAEINTKPTNPTETKNDETWIDALDWDEADKKVLREYVVNEKLTQFPSKTKKWLVILRWIVTKFEPDAHYTEKEVNAIISPINSDYASIRRDLVDYGYMRRQRGGGDYWLALENEGQEAI